jgi:hypothetical protein
LAVEGVGARREGRSIEGRERQRSFSGHGAGPPVEGDKGGRSEAAKGASGATTEAEPYLIEGSRWRSFSGHGDRRRSKGTREREPPDFEGERGFETEKAE